MNKKLGVLLVLALCIGVAACAVAAPADNFPNKRITIIAPWAAGGSADLLARAIAPYWARVLGVNMVVENYEGAGGQVGMTRLLNAADDGYTISAVMQPHLSLTVYTQDAPYTLEDFSFICMQQIDPVLFSVLNNSPYKTINDFVKACKDNPGKIAVGTNLNSGAHAMLLWMMEKLDIEFTVIPYSGGGEGRAALMGGHVDVYCGYVSSDYALREMCRSLGVFWDDTSLSAKLWPEAKTMSEQLGIDVPAMASYRGLMMHKSFKEKYPDRWQKIVDSYVKAYNDTEHQQNMEKAGVAVISTLMDPDASDALAREVDTIIDAYKGYFQP